MSLTSARPLRVTLALCALSFAAGCRSHSLREGVWELSFNAVEYMTNEPADVPSSRVLLRIDWSDDPEFMEEFDLIPIDKEGLPDIRFGVRRQSEDEAAANRKPVVTTIRAQQEPLWTYNFVGTIMSEEHIVGQVFTARHRLRDYLTLTG
ncbi:MAG TPA: hypothetical protein VK116_17555, partial [Planctomycetota bacterium]|nr:hypothetical protein [Planctomycetota bacterium]